MNDPIDNWLEAHPGRYAKVSRAARQWYVSLYVPEKRVRVSMGFGATLDGAFADALNDIMRTDGAHAEEATEEG